MFEDIPRGHHVELPVGERGKAPVPTAQGTSGSSGEDLTARELEVLELIGNGLGSREIAEKLHLSIKTIESHREHIKTKLGLTRAPELVSYAFNWVRGEEARSKGNER